jgi:hypothetical protein
VGVDPGVEHPASWATDGDPSSARKISKAAFHNNTGRQQRVRAHLTAPVARSEPAQVWVPVLVLVRVPVHQVAQRLAAPAAIRQTAHAVRLSSTSNLHAHRLAAPACKIRHHEYSN